MKFTFLGGADEVGASGMLIEIAGRRVLVDCGIRPSPKARYGLAGDQLPDLSLLDQAGGIDAILVTHAHTDHTGALELVAGQYPKIPIYATPPTIALTRVLHQDARRIMKTRLEEEGDLPLFDDVAVERLMTALEPVPFQTRLPLGEGLAVTFYPAGHIAGAAMLGLESDEGRVLISGDLSLSPQRTVNSAKLPNFEPDVLILESTYGGRLHANRAIQERRMIEVIAEVVAGGGKVLIPAFALGRAQEVLLILREFQRQGKLPPVPVWADGMVRAICQVYSSFSELLPLALQEQGAEFFSGPIRAIQTNEQRNALLWQTEPAIIVASSGMLAGGPAMAYARALAGQPQHAILLTGYQDEEAPGRRLQEMAERGRGSLWLGKDKVDVQCRIGTYSLSAHADEGQLISMVETLNPAQVVLVHGDDAARASLSKALEERKRSTYQPHSGQTLEFRFAIPKIENCRGMGNGRPLDARTLWHEIAGVAGGYFHVNELAQVWWGKDYGPAQLEQLAQALSNDNLYFGADTRRADVYRTHTLAQVEVTLHRRARMAELADLPGQWVSLRGPGQTIRLVRCTALASDYFWAETEEDEIERAWPEDLLVIFGTARPDPAAVQQQSGGVEAVFMEPNQTLALVNSRFPREARLRKTGYRLDQRVFVLTFDFPELARERYAALIATLEAESGWTMEIYPEANQNALFSLVQEVLPSGWRIVKGPALFRQNRQVAVTISGPTTDETAFIAASQRFQDESGFDLNLLRMTTGPALAPALTAMAPANAPLEINAAYAIIKAGLENTTLYRTSLKGSEIILSFISPQVGERYRAQIDHLARQVGWTLSINPQPNQGAILEAVRALLERAGLVLLKGPSVFPEKAEVTATLAGALDEIQQAELVAECDAQTGFRLVLGSAPVVTALPERAGDSLPAAVVMIPLARIRLRRFQREMILDPLKIEKAVDRVRRMGQISPPIQVRRVEDGYLLVDGLYRLRAAEKLGLEQIPAVVE